MSININKSNVTKLMKSKGCEFEIQMLLFYMDSHLDRLISAMKEESKEKIEFVTGQLNNVRTRLMELEYFNS